MADRTIDILLKLRPDDASMTATERGMLKQVTALKKVEEQANRTREKMEKLANVGSKLAMVGGAILAPFALSMKTYLDNAQKVADVNKTQLEPTAQRLKDLGEKWTQSQERLGRVTAEIVLPALEKSMVILDKIVSFAEANPGLVKAALTVGTTLVAAGALITTVAQVVSTIATIKGLFAGAQLAGIAGGAGGTATGIGAGGLVASIGPAIAAAIPVLVSAIAVWAGANLGLIITNALTGSNYTMTDVANTAKLILALNAKALDDLLGYFGIQSDLFKSVSDAIGITTEQQTATLKTISDNQTARINQQAVENTNAANQTASTGWKWVSDAIAGIGRWFTGGKAEGGYVTAGAYRVGERGREFVMSNATTQAAERAIGGRLSQNAMLGAVTNNLQLSNGVTIRQAKQIMNRNNAALINALAGGL